jgi:hypothetical protein
VAVTRPADIFAIIELTKPWLATRTEVTKEILEDFERRIPDAAKAFRKARRQAAEIESDVREAAKRRVRKATRIVRKIRQSTPWLRRTETIPRDVAERFVKRSAWWLTHSSGEPVRAPGHADRLRMSGHGSAVKFGANTFLVGKAIERCRNDLNDFFDEAAKGKRVELAVVRVALKRHISRAVANYNGDEYAGPYPISNDQLVFGAQAIDVNDGATFILDEARASELFV